MNEVRTYAIPSLYGISYLQETYIDQKRDDLQWYFNDLYKLFLYTLTSNLHKAETLSEEGEKKMLSMLKEIISVKNMLESRE